MCPITLEAVAAKLLHCLQVVEPRGGVAKSVVSLPQLRNPTAYPACGNNVQQACTAHQSICN